MSKRFRVMSGVALAGAAIMVMSGCSDSGAGSSAPSSSAAAPEQITVYNAQHESLTQQWADAFTAQTGIKVELRNGGDTELGNQLVAEGDKSPADVFLTENSPAIALVDNAGLLADVSKDVIDQVPSQYRPTTGTWTGIAARSTVFAYNKDLLPKSQLPASLLDLQSPAWKDRWAASPSGADFQAIVSALLELKGQDATSQWLSGMKTNVRTYQGNSTVMKAVNAGQIPGGVIYHYYWFGDQAKGGENSDNVALHYFKNQDPGAFVSISGGGVLKSSKKQDAGQQFLKFITSKAGQEILQNGTSFEYPVASEVPANAALVPLADLQAPVVDPAKLNSPETTTLMTEAGIL